MADYVISVISQKGGVGKSSLAQLVAQGYAANQYGVLLADMDAGQASSVKWNSIRQASDISPSLTVKSFNTVVQANQESSLCDLLVFDGAPHATAQTLDIGKLSDLILLPTNTSKFDLDPQINLAHELVRSGVKRDRIVFVFSRIVATPNDLGSAYVYIASAEYRALPAYLEEKTGYRHAAEQGKALTETSFKTLAERGQVLFGNISTSLLKVIRNDKKTSSK